MIELPVTVINRKHPQAKCEECPLAEVGKYVPSKGPDKASLAVVGEAPGRGEVLAGEPFTGPSGQLLDMVLRHYRIKRSDIVLTNACLCRPPDNATPPKSAIQACRPRLEDELRAAEVSTVVALGNTASLALLDKDGITALRVGPAKEAAHLPGVRVVPTIHPAACLRQGDQFPNLVGDFAKIRSRNVVWTEPQIDVVDTDVDAIEYLARLDTAGTPRVVIDIEVDIEKDAGSFGHPNQYGMLCVGICYARGRVVVLSEGVMASEEVRDALGSFLTRPGRAVTAHNGKFDLEGCYPVIGPIELHFDTMLASYVCDERTGGIHSLEYNGVEKLGYPSWKHVLDQYNVKKLGYGAAPRDVLYKYCAYDCATTWDLQDFYEAKFDKAPELRKVHDFLVMASNQLMYIELNGIAVDREYLDKLEGEYLKRLADIEADIDEIVMRATDNQASYDKKGTINPRSPQQVKAFLKDMLIRVDSTDKDTLKFLQGRLSPDAPLEFVEALLLYRREAKLYGTYVKGIRKRLYRGRVYPTFLLHGTTTGRLACRNPNMQNIPRESSIRRLFVPAKADNVFVQSDYAQAELRVLSFLAGDAYFRDIFNGGDRDLFDELTPVLYPEAVPPQYGFSAPEEFAAWKELRIRVKAFVYGLSYGREAGSIAEEFGITRGQAERLQRNFFKVIPEIVKFREDTRNKVLRGEDLITPWGRHRRFPLITQHNRHEIMNEALAFLPQSTASDMCLQAAAWARKELKGVAYIRNLVHDSILAECHENDGQYVAETLDRLMVKSAETIVGDYVKFATDYKIGKHWGEV